MLPEIVGWQRSTIITILFNHFIKFKGRMWQFQVGQEVWEAVVPALPLCLCFGALPDRPPRLRDLGRNTRLLQVGCTDQDPDSAGWRGGILSFLLSHSYSLPVTPPLYQRKSDPKHTLSSGVAALTQKSYYLPQTFPGHPANMENSLVNSFKTESNSFPHKHSTASVGSSPMGTTKGNIWKLQE